MATQDLSYIISRHSPQYQLRTLLSSEGISRPLQVAPLPHSRPHLPYLKQQTPSEATLTLAPLHISNLSKAISRAAAVQSV